MFFLWNGEIKEANLILITLPIGSCLPCKPDISGYLWVCRAIINLVVIQIRGSETTGGQAPLSAPTATLSSYSHCMAFFFFLLLLLRREDGVSRNAGNSLQPVVWRQRDSCKLKAELNSVFVKCPQGGTWHLFTSLKSIIFFYAYSNAKK